MHSRGRGSGRGRGQSIGAGPGNRGGGAGGGGGMGAGGTCLCPKCGRSYPHHQGAPCLKERCEGCGVALIREGSAHHEQLIRSRGETGGAGTEG